MQDTRPGSMQVKDGDSNGWQTPPLRDLDRASRLLQSRLEGQDRPRSGFARFLFGRRAPLRVWDAAWIIQACLDAADTAPADPDLAAFREQAHGHLRTLAERAQIRSSPDAAWRGMGWGCLLSSTVPLRCESAALGDLFLRAAEQIKTAWALDAAKSVHVFLSANAGRLFEEGDQFCLSNFIDAHSEEASLAASAMSAAFSARLFHHLDFDGGDVGFAQRLMRGVVNRQRDQGNWPPHWSANGGHGEQDLVEHARMLQALADYMVVRDGDYEPNYRYGIQWLMETLSDPGWNRVGPGEAAASVLALTRAQQYWAREADDVDFTFAASCGEKVNELAAVLRRPPWRRPASSSSMVLAAEAQRGRYQMWAADPDR